MRETAIALFVTGLFVAAGRFAVGRWLRSADRIVRADYALHIFMAIAMIVMSWLPMPGAFGQVLAIAFAAATVWFAGCAVRGGPVPTRFRLLATYHAGMMAAMALMAVAMASPGHLASIPPILGVVLTIAALFWLVRAARGTRRDPAEHRRRLGGLRAYEFAMALGMAVMSLSHTAS